MSEKLSKSEIAALNLIVAEMEEQGIDDPFSPELNVAAAAKVVARFVAKEAVREAVKQVVKNIVGGRADILQELNEALVARGESLTDDGSLTLEDLKNIQKSLDR